jgi:hypothetical protein
MNYTWEITSIKKKDTENLSDVIFQVYWKKIGTDENGNIGEFSGATPLDVDNLNNNEFSNYENLTEEIVLGWVKSIVIGDYERHVNDQIKRKINLQINSEINSFPWSSPEDVVTPKFDEDLNTQK